MVKFGKSNIMGKYDDTSKFGLQSSQRECDQGEALGGCDATKKEGSVRPRVCITSYRVRIFDDKDNKYGGAKALLDSLTYSGLILGDSEKEIDYEVKQIKVAHRKEERTEVDIDYGD